MRKEAIKAIREKFQGKVLNVGNDKAFANGNSASEYGYSANRRTEEKTKEAKYRASAELNNVLEIGERIPEGEYKNQKDTAQDGWRYYRTRFKVGEDFYVGIINVKPSERGWLMHDVTQIQKSRQATLSSSGKTASSDTHVSNDSISDSGEKFNEKFSLKEDSDFEYDEDSNLTREQQRQVATPEFKRRFWGQQGSR